MLHVSKTKKNVNFKYLIFREVIYRYSENIYFFLNADISLENMI